MGIRFPDEGYIKEAISDAEDQLLRRTGHCFHILFEDVDEAGGVISAVRDDRAEARWDLSLPRSEAPLKLNAFERCQRDRRWFKECLWQFVDRLACGLEEDEPAPQAQPEQRFAVIIAFGSRPDVVLTPEQGVPTDEAVRVFNSFLAGAAAIGGRPAMLPLGA